MIQGNVVTAEVPVTRRVRRGGTLICLVGIDGSGKSTQAAALVDSLRRRDVDAVHAWARWKPILLLPLRHLGRALARRRGGAADDDGTFTASKRKVLGGPLRATLWKNLSLLEHAGQVFFKVRVPLMMGRTVVADRYVYDTLIDLSVNLDRAPEDLLNERLLHLFPTPVLSILLDVSAETGAARKRDGTTVEYLAERTARYRKLAESLRMERVDAERPPAEVHAEILRRVWKRLGP